MHALSEHVARQFGHAAPRYDMHATLQYDVLKKVAALVTHHICEHVPLLDVGAGTGRLAALLPERNIIAIDRAEGMCLHAQRQRHLPAICADATALPLRDASCMTYVSSLCWQWVAHRAAIGELHRLLARDGIAIIATLHEETFAELRDCFSALGLPQRMLHFCKAEVLQERFTAQPLHVIAYERQTYQQHFPSAQGFFRQLHGIGATLSGDAPPLSVAHMRALTSHYDTHHRDAAGVCASYEVGYWVVAHERF
ncbi:MAG: methyltransferase domain-containing protein [Sphaerospermopsis sp. SIO1G2]|nr:methyltransferase domain-containing protein [Sphaerospermopsis sp. SIO1G2]